MIVSKYLLKNKRHSVFCLCVLCPNLSASLSTFASTWRWQPHFVHVSLKVSSLIVSCTCVSCMWTSAASVTTGGMNWASSCSCDNFFKKLILFSCVVQLVEQLRSNCRDLQQDRDTAVAESERLKQGLWLTSEWGIRKVAYRHDQLFVFILG